MAGQVWYGTAGTGMEGHRRATHGRQGKVGIGWSWIGVARQERTTVTIELEDPEHDEGHEHMKTFRRVKARKGKVDPQTHRLIMQSFDLFAKRLKEYPHDPEAAEQHIVASYQHSATWLLAAYKDSVAATGAQHTTNDITHLATPHGNMGFFSRLRFLMGLS